MTITTRQLVKIGLCLVTGFFLATLPTSSLMPKQQTSSSPAMITNNPQEFPLMPEQLQHNSSEENEQDTFVFHTPDGSLHKTFASLPGEVLQQYVVQNINYVLSQTKQGVFIGAQQINDGEILWRMLLCPYSQLWWCSPFLGKAKNWFYVTSDQKVYVLKFDSIYEVDMIDRRNGALLWKFPVEDSIPNNSPRIGGDDHRLFISYRSQEQKPSDEGEYCLLLDAISGKVVKLLSFPIFSEQMRILNGVLYFDDQEPTDIYALRISDSKFLWKQHYSGTKAPLQWEIGDHLYLRFSNGIRAANLANGKTLWNKEVMSGGILGISNNELYYLAIQDDHIDLTLFHQSDGSVLWKTTWMYHPHLTPVKNVTVVPMNTLLLGWNPIKVEFLPIATNMFYITVQGWPMQTFANRAVVYAINKVGQEMWCGTVTNTNEWQDCGQQQSKIPATKIKPFVGRWIGHGDSITITPDGHAHYLSRLYCPAPECSIYDDIVVVNYDDVINVNIQFTRLEGNTLYGIILANSLRIKQTITLSLEDGDRVKTSGSTYMCGPKALAGTCGA
jgi:hypothetical protein